MDASSDVGKARGASRSFAKLCPHLEPAAQLIEVHIYTEGMMDPRQNQTEGEMRKVLLGCCLTAMVAVPVIAQGGSTGCEERRRPSLNTTS
jgi:hypothetical protein